MFQSKFFIACSLVFAFHVAAKDLHSEDFSQLEAKSYSKTQERRRKNQIHKNTQKGNDLHKKPTFAEANLFERPNQLFFRTDIGLGLLYFKQVQGNLGILPSDIVSFSQRNSPFNGRLRYNRTPLYDFQLGYRLWSYVSFSLSYMHQGNVTIQTPIIFSPQQGNTTINYNQLTANLSLDTLMIKAYGELPLALMWKRALLNIYLGTGVGAGWQSWTSIEQNGIQETANYSSRPINFKQKIVNTVTWTADAGIRLQSSAIETTFNVLAGCKFNLWGQTTGLGELSEQGNYKFGLFKPLRIKSIYQWAPYLGLQWNFPSFDRMPVRKENTKELSPLFTQMNVGLGLLYFKKINGNLVAKPNLNGNSNNAWQSAPVTQNISYNRTPLFEYLIQYRIGSFAQLGLSYQTQSGITVQTEPVGSSSLMPIDYSQFVSYLSLNAIQLKGYLKVPLSDAYKNTQFSPYVGLGFGPGWQTWNRSYVNRNGLVATTELSEDQPIRQKIVANPTLNLDLGLEILRKNPWQSFSMLAGCKFNYWGQVRNLGEESEQGSSNFGLQQPFRVKKLYQWAPYLGVQWNFPYFYSKKSYFLDGKDPNTWVPYIIPLSLLQDKKQYFAQFSAAIGFLYFSGVQGNFSPSPAALYQNISTNVPLRGRLTYNRSPLFDYVFGYHLGDGFDIVFSYQHQGNVTVQTQVLTNEASVGTYSLQQTQFSADLLLDAVMMKLQYEAQRALVFKNLAYSPYFGIGLGPTWQTWKRVGDYQTYNTQGYQQGALTNLREKICANVGFSLDGGVRMRSPFPEVGFSASMGMKFQIWGQARNIGGLNQVGSPSYGLSHPFKIRTVYQWAPYVGIQWNF